MSNFKLYNHISATALAEAEASDAHCRPPACLLDHYTAHAPVIKDQIEIKGLNTSFGSIAANITLPMNMCIWSPSSAKQVPLLVAKLQCWTGPLPGFPLRH